MLSAVQAAASHTNKVKNKVFPGRAAPAQTLPPGGGMGKPGFPIPLLERQSVSTKQTAPALTLPPLGAGTRRLPQAGGGWEGGRTLRTMVTSAVHAAPLRTDGMHILPGRAAPSQTLPGAGAGVRGPPARVR